MRNVCVANLIKMKIYRWVWVNISVHPGSTEPGFILMKSDKYFSSRSDAIHSAERWLNNQLHVVGIDVSDSYQQKLIIEEVFCH